MKKTIIVSLFLLTFMFGLNGTVFAKCFEVIKRGVYITYCDSSVTTPKGTLINKNVYQAKTDFSSTKKTSIINEYKKTYPNAKLIMSPTTKFNCHSYAWYSQSSTNNKWLDSPGDDVYWNDKSYIKTTNELQYQKVSYVNGDHSGVVKPNMCGVVISKWGDGPLMEHGISDCPYKSTGLNFYKKN